MRRLLFVVCAVVAAAFVVSLSTLSAKAQSAEQYGPSENERAASPDRSRAQSSTPPPKITDPSKVYYNVADDAITGGSKGTGWERRADAAAQGGDYVQAGSGNQDAAARFRVSVPKTRLYTVYALWPAGKGNATAARVGVPTVSGTKWDEVNQKTDGGFWVRIGAFKMQKGERTVQVEGANGEGRAVADAVMIVDDVLVGPDGGTASYANPEEFASTEPTTGGTATKSDTTTSTRATSTRTGREVVRIALRHRGTPYGYSPCRFQVREDCSCHTLLVYRHFGFRLPDSPVNQWKLNYAKDRRKGWLLPGDLVFQDLNRDGRLSNHFADHVGIYVGNNSIVHASNYFNRVVVTDLRYLPNYWGGMRPRPLR